MQIEATGGRSRVQAVFQKSAVTQSHHDRVYSISNASVLTSCRPDASAACSHGTCFGSGRTAHWIVKAWPCIARIVRRRIAQLPVPPSSQEAAALTTASLLIKPTVDHARLCTVVKFASDASWSMPRRFFFTRLLPWVPWDARVGSLQEHSRNIQDMHEEAPDERLGLDLKSNDIWGQGRHFWCKSVLPWLIWGARGSPMFRTKTITWDAESFRLLVPVVTRPEDEQDWMVKDQSFESSPWRVITPLACRWMTILASHGASQHGGQRLLQSFCAFPCTYRSCMASASLRACVCTHTCTLESFRQTADPQKVDSTVWKHSLLGDYPPWCQVAALRRFDSKRRTRKARMILSGQFRPRGPCHNTTLTCLAAHPVLESRLNGKKSTASGWL